MKELYESIFDIADTADKMSDEVAFKMQWFKELNDFAYDIMAQIKIICKKHTHMDVDFKELPILGSNFGLKKDYTISFLVPDFNFQTSGANKDEYNTSPDLNIHMYRDMLKDITSCITRTVKKYRTIKKYVNYNKDQDRFQVSFENILYPDMKPKYLFISTAVVYPNIGIMMIDVCSDPDVLL